MYDGTFTFWSHFIFGFIKGDQGGSKGIKTDQGRSKRIKTDQRGSRVITVNCIYIHVGRGVGRV